MKKCHDCGRMKRIEDMVVLYTRENGEQIWVCHFCHGQRDEVDRAEQTAARAEIDEMVWRNEWEEG